MGAEEAERNLGWDRATVTTALGRLSRVADTLPRLWVIVSLAAIFIMPAWIQVRPNDFWWHVRVGQWIVEHGRVPRTDLFSFTQIGEPWAYQSWLMEVALYGLLSLGGLPLVIFAHALLITGAYALLLRVNARASGGGLRWASIATIGAAVAGVGNWNVRPQAISFPLFALTLYLTERHFARPPAVDSGWWRAGALWWLPPLFAVWANAHGGFVFGLALLGTTLCARLVDWLRGRTPFPSSLLLMTALSAAATLLTPLGLGMVDYVLGFVRHPVTRQFNLEFMPPTVRGAQGKLFFGFVGAWVTLLIVSRYRPSLREALRLLPFGVLALMAVRGTVWFGLVAAPTMAASLDLWAAGWRRARPERKGRRWLNRVFAAVAGVLALLSLPWLRPYMPMPQVRRPYLSSDTPVEAVAFLCNLPQPGRVFHSEVYGSYLIWACSEVPVFADTRIELYPEEQWMDYLALGGGRYDWQALLDDYGIDTLLLRRDGQESLIEAATAATGWERVYEDDQAVILRQAEGP